MKNWRTFLLSICILMMIIPQTVLAAVNWGKNGKGKIIVFHDLLEGSVPEGTTEEAQVTLYQVERLVKRGNGQTTEWTESFQNCGISLENLKASKTEEAADNLAAYVRKKEISGQKQKVKIGEKVTFSHLEYGTYLILNDMPENYNAMTAMLVSVPVWEKPDWNPQVEVCVKAERTQPVVPTLEDVKSKIPVGDDSEKNTLSESKLHKLPQTGPIRWPIPVAAVLGMGLLLIGIFRRKGKTKLYISSGSLMIVAALVFLFCQEYEGYEAGKTSEEILQEYEQTSLKKIETGKKDGKPVQVRKSDYIGEVEIPSIGVTLPVSQSLSYPQLRQTPCRYTGSVEKDSLIIAAHNYARHFGRIKTLENGDEILFTDSDGKEYQYQVDEVTILQPYDVDGMIAGDWDLTLFTCTYGGQNRVTVRCSRV